jgi:hypothetical protein
MMKFLISLPIESKMVAVYISYKHGDALYRFIIGHVKSKPGAHPLLPGDLISTGSIALDYFNQFQTILRSLIHVKSVAPCTP